MILLVAKAWEEALFENFQQPFLPTCLMFMANCDGTLDTVASVSHFFFKNYPRHLFVFTLVKSVDLLCCVK